MGSFYDSNTYLQDLNVALSHTVEKEKLKNCKILITGATGTIGSFIVDMLLYFNEIYNANITIYIAGRNVLKMKARFSCMNDTRLIYMEYDARDVIRFEVNVDYIIHAAGNAHPSAFNGDPVGTIMENISGTYNLLKLGKNCNAKRMLYISSGEIYGQGDLSLESFEESYAGYMDTMLSRACYPISKRAAENLCASYTKQYALETVIVRQCHTYGPGITETDSRAHAQFIRNVLKNENVVLKSAGSQMRSYNYVADCASAILSVLIKGKTGEAYNIANPNIRITIAQLAKAIAEQAGKEVVFENPGELDLENRTPIAKQVLNTKKLEDLGWKAAFTIDKGIKNTLCILKEIEK